MLIYPNKTSIGPLFPRARSNLLVPFLESLHTPGAAERLTNVLQLSHFIAQVGVESAYFDTWEEYASGAAYEGREDLGNVRRGDGRLFKGRGPFQLTGRDNYRRATPFVRELLNRPELDLVANPTIVASDVAVGTAAALWYWETHHLGDWADRNDASAVSRGVNRGNPESNKLANNERERIALTNRVLPIIQKLQVGTPPSQLALDKPPPGSRVLRRGDRGEDVAALQQFLGVDDDGVFGEDTEAAVKKFQKKVGLSADGVVGSATQAAIAKKEK